MSSTEGSGNRQATTLHYDVLYYKRALAGKVHRDKGVSKCDGTLTLDPSTGRVTLREPAGDQGVSSDTDDDEYNNSKKLSWNKRRGLQQSKKVPKSKNEVLFSGIIRDLTSRALVVDDIIPLGGFDVQVTGLQQQSSTATASGQPTAGNIQPVNHGIAAAKPMATMGRKVVAAPLQSKRLVQHSTITPLHRSTVTSLHAKPRCVSMTPTPLVPKNPPLQPNNANASTSNTMKSVPRSVLPQKRKALPTQTVAAPAVVPVVQRNKPVPTIAATKPALKTTSTAQVLPHIPLPGSIRDVLRPHQVECVDFLWRTLDEKKGAILGDEMGLGKTLMTIAVLTALHRRDREKQFVVVCPASLVTNWACEFDKWLGKASQPKRVVIHKGGPDGLSQIRAYTLKMKKQVQHQPGQVLIVSYELFRRNADEFVFPDGMSVGLLVVDEAHRLKSTTGTTQTLAALESLPADARLCITATPIQNNLSEFYSLANFCCPGLLGDDLASFRRQYERPIAAANQKNATTDQLAAGRGTSRELEEVSKTFMIRRLQKDVLSSMLPPRTEALLLCRPSARQCQLYRALTQSKLASNDSIADALTTLTALRQICCHPSCYSSNAAGVSTGASSNESSDLTLSGKLVVLEKLLHQIRRHAPNDKVVIVSNFTSALSIVESLVLEPNAFPFLRLDGTTKDRQTVVDTFNRTSAEVNFCFLISSKAGGCGLNVVGANRLIMFDADWNPSTDIQAMGRIYRQGQTKPCTIYRLFTSGTVEEIIYQRQTQKGGLSTLTVDAGTDKKSQRSSSSSENASKFTKEELADCFNLKERCACDTKAKVGNRWPDYDGSRDCLEASGCLDEPLLELVDSIADTLLYVHIASDKTVSDKLVEEDDVADDAASIVAFGSGVEDDNASVDNDSENEF